MTEFGHFVKGSLKVGSTKNCKDEEEKESEVPPMDQMYLELNYDNIHKELSDNKQLIKMTEGREDGEGGSSGSESDPSEDNMEEEEIAQYVP